MGGAKQRGDALTKATQGADGSLDPFTEFLLPFVWPFIAHGYRRALV